MKYQFMSPQILNTAAIIIGILFAWYGVISFTVDVIDWLTIKLKIVKRKP